MTEGFANPSNSSNPFDGVEPQPRVLFLNTRSALGADVAVHLSLIQNFDPEKVAVFLATNRNSVDLNATLEAVRTAPKSGVLVYDLGHELSAKGGVGKLWNGLKNTGALVSLLRLAQFVRRERIGLLHTTDRPRDAALTTLLARLTGARTVLHLHNKWHPRIGRAAIWAAREAVAVIAISQFTRQSLIDGGVPAGKIFTTYNATDTAQFNPATVRRGALRERLGISAGTPLIGIAARVIVWKGHLDLVEAFAKVLSAVPGAHLAIVGRESRPDPNGDEGYAGKVRRRIWELGLDERVHWAGWQEAMPEIMADLDVTALPSWEEPFGLVVTESMAMERPVVGYRSGALPEIITDGVEGLLVPRGDIDALADALVQLLKDPARREEMGRRGRERVLKQFAPRRQAEEVEGLYRSL